MFLKINLPFRVDVEVQPPCLSELAITWGASEDEDEEEVEEDFHPFWFFLICK